MGLFVCCFLGFFWGGVVVLIIVKSYSQLGLRFYCTQTDNSLFFNTEIRFRGSRKEYRYILR